MLFFKKMMRHFFIFVLFFFVALIIKLPYSSIASYVLTKYLSSEGISYSYSSMNSSLFNTKIENLEIEVNDNKFNFDTVSLSYSPLSVFTKRMKGELLSVYGNFNFLFSRKKLHVDNTIINLERIPFSFLEGIKGTLSVVGTYDMDSDFLNTHFFSSDVNVDLSGFDFSEYLNNPMVSSLKELNVTSLTFDVMGIRSGSVLEIKDFSAQSKEFKILLEGNVILSEYEPEESILSLDGSILFGKLKLATIKLYGPLVEPDLFIF